MSATGAFGHHGIVDRNDRIALAIKVESDIFAARSPAQANVLGKLVVRQSIDLLHVLGVAEGADTGAGTVRHHSAEDKSGKASLGAALIDQAQKLLLINIRPAPAWRRGWRGQRQRARRG